MSDVPDNGANKHLEEGELMSGKKVLAIPALIGVLTVTSAAFAAGSVTGSTANDPTFKVCVKLGVVYGAKTNGACPAGSVGTFINAQGLVGPPALKDQRGHQVPRDRPVSCTTALRLPSQVSTSPRAPSKVPIWGGPT